MAIKPARHNFSVVKGTTFHPTITLYTDEGAASPKPLVDYTASFRIYDQATSATLVTLTTENGGISLDDTNGEVEFFISDETTDTFTWTHALYHFFLIDPEGNSDPILFGAFIVQRL